MFLMLLNSWKLSSKHKKNGNVRLAELYFLKLVNKYQGKGTMQSSFTASTRYPNVAVPPVSVGTVPSTMAQQGLSNDYANGAASDADGSRRDRRAHHTALERRRRDHIKDRFAVLHAEIPGLAVQEKVSRSLILTRATEYIQQMTDANEQVVSEVEELQKQQSQLQEQVRQLEQQQAQHAQNSSPVQSVSQVQQLGHL